MIIACVSLLIPLLTCRHAGGIKPDPYKLCASPPTHAHVCPVLPCAHAGGVHPDPLNTSSTRRLSHKPIHPCAPHAGGINPDPLKLCAFQSKADVDKWRVFTDAAFGGSSNAVMELGPEAKVPGSATHHADWGNLAWGALRGA